MLLMLLFSAVFHNVADISDIKDTDKLTHIFIDLDGTTLQEENGLMITELENTKPMTLRTTPWIQEQINAGKNIYFLTARPEGMRDTTQQQLAHVGLYQEEQKKTGRKSRGYQDIIFTNNAGKGQILKQFLSKHEIAPEKTAFINNLKSQLTSVNNAEKNINLYLVDPESKNVIVENDVTIPKSYTFAHPFARAIPGKTAAGVLAYVKNADRSIQILLGKRRGENVWGNFGGASDEEDSTLLDTAVRETQEESIGLFDFTQGQLANTFSHDLVTKDGNLYRMYIAPHKFIDADIFKSALGNAKDTHQKEYTDFAWVDLDGLLDAAEQQGAIMINGKSEKLHAPFLQMLRQAPVLKALRALSWHLQPSGVHTKGNVDLPMEMSEKILPDSSTDPQAQEYALAHDFVTKHIPMLQEFKRQQSIVIDKPAGKKPLYSATRGHLLLENPHSPQAPQQAIYNFFLHHGNAVDRYNMLRIFNPENNASLSPDNRFIKNALLNAYEKEEQMRNWYVFYHALQGHLAFFYEIYSIFRNYFRLHQPNVSNIHSLRGLDIFFKEIGSVQAFINEQIEKQKVLPKNKEITNFSAKNLDNYAADYQQKGLSVNLSLLGSYTNSTSATYYLFTNNANIQPPNFQELSRDFLNRLGLQSIEKYEAIWEKYKDRINTSRLLQIFIHPDVVDQMAYFSQPGGIALVADQSTLKPSETLTQLKNNPAQFSGTISPVARGIKDVQVRIFLDPKRMTNPNDVQIYDYKKFDHMTALALRKELEAVIAQDIETFLKEKIRLSEGTLEIPSGQDNPMPPIQRAYKQLHESKIGTYELKAPAQMMLMYIVDQNATDLEELLKANPNLDLITPVPDPTQKYREKIAPIDLAMKKHMIKPIQKSLPQDRFDDLLRVSGQFLAEKIMEKNWKKTVDFLKNNPDFWEKSIQDPTNDYQSTISIIDLLLKYNQLTLIQETLSPERADALLIQSGSLLKHYININDAEGIIAFFKNYPNFYWCDKFELHNAIAKQNNLFEKIRAHIPKEVSAEILDWVSLFSHEQERYIAILCETEDTHKQKKIEAAIRENDLFTNLGESPHLAKNPLTQYQTEIPLILLMCYFDVDITFINKYKDFFHWALKHAIDANIEDNREIIKQVITKQLPLFQELVNSPGNLGIVKKMPFQDLQDFIDPNNQEFIEKLIDQYKNPDQFSNLSDLLTRFPDYALKILNKTSKYDNKVAKVVMQHIYDANILKNRITDNFDVLKLYTQEEFQRLYQRISDENFWDDIIKSMEDSSSRLGVLGWPEHIWDLLLSEKPSRALSILDHSDYLLTFFLQVLSDIPVENSFIAEHYQGIFQAIKKIDLSQLDVDHCQFLSPEQLSQGIMDRLKKIVPLIHKIEVFKKPLLRSIQKMITNKTFPKTWENKLDPEVETSLEAFQEAMRQIIPNFDEEIAQIQEAIVDG